MICGRSAATISSCRRPRPSRTDTPRFGLPRCVVGARAGRTRRRAADAAANTQPRSRVSATRPHRVADRDQPHRACRRRAARRCGEPGGRAGHVVAGLRARLVPALQRPRPRPGVDAGALRARLGRRAARLRSRRVFAVQLLHRQRHQSFLRLLHLPGDLRHAALGDARRGVDRGRDGGALHRHQFLHLPGARAQALRPQHLPDPHRPSGGRRGAGRVSRRAPPPLPARARTARRVAAARAAAAR